MLDEKVVLKLKERYSNLHPLIFHRSVERSNTLGELFDILDSCPTTYPIVWNESIKRWVTTKDLKQFSKFNIRGKND